MRKFIYYIFIICFYLSSAFADETCTLTGETCVEGAATKNIGGKDVYKPCWKYKTTYHCFEPTVDNCQPLKTAGCEQVNSVCNETDSFDKKCNNYQNTYRCLNPFVNVNDKITLLENSFSTTDHLDYSQCQGRDVLPNCSVESSVCKQPEQTRNINGRDIHKSCWQFENTYSCTTGNNINRCTNIPDYCKFSSSMCLAKAGNSCSHTQNTYVCSRTENLTPQQVQCGANLYCINGQCDATQDNNPNDFAKAIAYLQAINESADSNGDAYDLKIFGGNANSCSVKVAGYNNCCKDQGWGQDAGASCSESEQRLMQLQSNRQCHYVGSYCSKKTLGVCLETTKGYCCFNSKISRVIVEQGRSQLGMSFGSAESPNCRGFTPEELQRLRFDQMDLSEISADIANSVVIPDKQYLENKAKEAVERISTTSPN